MAGTSRARKNTTGRKGKWLGLALAAVLLVAAGAAAGFFWSQRTGGAGASADIQVDPGAVPWTGPQIQEAGGGASEGIQIPGYPSITLPADTQNVSVALLNPEGNPCYFTFELALLDTDEVLYTSGQVPPGQALYEIELSRPLEAGEYDAVIRISTASLDDGSPMNGANVETVLIVQ